MAQVLLRKSKTDATGQGSAKGTPAVDSSLRRVAVLTGAGLLVLAVLAGFANFVAVEGLVTRGDAARTAADIAASESLFRFGIAAMLLAVALDVAVAWGLYRVFRSVNASVSMVSAWFRLAYSAVFTVSIAHLASAMRLIDDASASPLPTEHVQALALMEIEAFDDIWQAGLVLFGIHLLVEGYLVARSRIAPRLLGPLVALAGAGYVFDGVARVLTGGSAPVASSVTFIGEFLFAVWLVAGAGRSPRSL